MYIKRLVCAENHSDFTILGILIHVYKYKGDLHIFHLDKLSFFLLLL